MDVTVSSGHRLRVGLLSGACLALGWAALSVILGSSPAHADDSGGLLGGAGELLGNTTSAVVSTVGDTTSAVAGTVDAIVAPVQSAVQQTAPIVSGAVGAASAGVPDAAQPVIDAVTPASAVADPVTAAVTDAVGSVSSAVPEALAPVSSALASSSPASLTDPLADTLVSVPIVGDATARLGVPALLARLNGALDSVARALNPVLGGAGPSDPVVVPPAGAGSTGGTVGIGSRGTDQRLPEPGAVPGSAVGPPLRIHDRSPSALVHLTDSRTGAGDPAPPLPSAPTPSGAPGPWATGAGSSSSSAGSGAGSTSWFATFSTLQTATPSLGAPTGTAADDALPSSPVYPTDVSPD
ncbi:hypothetical protein LXM50_08470 [Microbacterium sp. Au-Mic1]|uniref:hypothetical protein n=1 Tax=Microbacterium sp. Au-Mic1 TaxID=2906457 RepID=UPI001E630B6D|nr:hypothetical protein [Microbacterium sp. Au-Mic1]MCE4026005.1 hypothetical protein [Microbacterium sp. Au-Mic1]